MNTQRVYEGNPQTIGTGSKGMNVSQGRSNGRGRVYGDVIVNSNTYPDIILGNVLDTKGIVDLIKALKWSRNVEIAK